MGMRERVASLEAMSGNGGVVCILQYCDQSQADTIAAYEAANGPIGKGSLNVIIRKPFPAPDCA